MSAAARTRLESWKAIAAHFGRDVTTVRRWERREGMPVHRLLHEKLGSIYAYTDELESWWTARTAREAFTAGHAPPRQDAPSDDMPGGAAQVDATDARGLPTRGRRLRAAVAALALIGVAALLGLAPQGLVTARRHGHSRAVVASAAGVLPAVAVLPLVHAPGNDGEPYFTDGMTTALTAELAARPSISVIAHTSARRYRGRDGRSVPAIARELGVGWVVDGSVLRAGNRVRITVELVSVENPGLVWSRRFERPIDGVLELQADVGRAVALQILGPGATSRDAQAERHVPSVDTRAYELYLRGEFHTEQLTPVSLARAVGYHTQAVAADPGFAPAWAGLAKANLLQESWGGAGAGTRAADVRRATLRAVALDPRLAEAHDVMGRVLLVYDRDWAAAEAAFRRAIAERPSLAVAYNGYSILLQTLVRTDESLVAAAKARELDPMTAWAWTEEGRALYRARRYAEAEERYRRALAIDGSFAPAVDRLVQLYLVRRRLPEARGMLDLLERLPSSRGSRRLRAWLAAVEGDRVEALELASKLANPYVVHIELGDRGAAFDVLERAAAAGTLAGFALGNPELDPLRRDPRFARLVTQMGLPVDRVVALGSVRGRGSG